MISIIVPIYNVEKYLKDCLDSILKQSYTNFELILVNDGSLDNSLAICKEYEKKDQRIILINKDNGGLSSARNAGLDVARGEYIVFIDSDDWVESNYLELLLSNLLATNADISQCHFISQKELDSIDIKNEKEKISVLGGKEVIKHLYNRKKYLTTVVVWNKLYKRKVFDDLRFVEGIINEDEEIVYKLLYKVQKVVLTEAILYHYRIRENSIMRSGFNIKKFDIIKCFEDRLKFFEMKKEKDLYLMTIPIYFRILISMRTKVKNIENIEIQKKYISEIENKINSIIKHTSNNEYMTISYKFLVFLYRINPKLTYSICSMIEYYRR